MLIMMLPLHVLACKRAAKTCTNALDAVGAVTDAML
jgi:hypothetical protein